MEPATMANPIEQESSKRKIDLVETSDVETKASFAKVSEEASPKTVVVEEKGPPAVGSQPKRARTAYFIFMEENRPTVQKELVGEGVAAVAKALGQKWSALSVEEKKIYQDKASVEKEAAAKALEAWKAAGGTSNAEQTDDQQLIMPVARIRRICKMDPDVSGLSKEAVPLICKAAELFTTRLGREAVKVAALQNRRKLHPSDVAEVCSSREAFSFLREDMTDLLKQQEQEFKGKEQPFEVAKPAVSDASEVPSITSFFTSKAT